MTAGTWFDSQSSSLCDGHLEKALKEEDGGGGSKALLSL